MFSRNTKRNVYSKGVKYIPSILKWLNFMMLRSNFIFPWMPWIIDIIYHFSSNSIAAFLFLHDTFAWNGKSQTFPKQIGKYIFRRHRPWHTSHIDLVWGPFHLRGIFFTSMVLYTVYCVECCCVCIVFKLPIRRLTVDRWILRAKVYLKLISNT